MEIEIKDFDSRSLLEIASENEDTDILELLGMSDKKLDYTAERIFTLGYQKSSGKIVGGVSGRWRPPFGRRDQGDVYIESIRVVSGLRGNGIGKQLVEDIFMRVRARVDIVSMTIEPDDEEKKERWKEFLNREVKRFGLELRECCY